MIFLKVFIVGGLICLIGQIIMDLLKITPAHMLVLLVFLGGLLEVFSLYDKIIKFGSSGALIPITSFGHITTEYAIKGVKENGFLGLLSNLFIPTSIGISFAIIMGFITALIFKPKD